MSVTKVSSLNIQRNLFLEREEVSALQQFMIQSFPQFAFERITKEFGIVLDPLGVVASPMLVEVGTNPGTIKISNDAYAVDSNYNLIYTQAFDNKSITATDTWYWVKLSYREYRAEPGTVSVTADGQVTGVGTEFTSLLRGQSNKAPTYIKFYNEDAEGNEVSVSNTDIYEVVSINNDTSMVINGEFSVESGIKYIVVGAYTLGTVLSTEQKAGLYKYGWSKIEFIEETVTDTAPTAGYTEGLEFYLARVYYDSGSGLVTVQDKREDYWELDFGGIIDDTKMDRAGSLEAFDFTSSVSDEVLATSTRIVQIDYDVSQGNVNIAVPSSSSNNLGDVIYFSVDFQQTGATKGDLKIREGSVGGTEIINVSDEYDKKFQLTYTVKFAVISKSTGWEVVLLSNDINAVSRDAAIITDCDDADITGFFTGTSAANMPPGTSGNFVLISMIDLDEISYHIIHTGLGVYFRYLQPPLFTDWTPLGVKSTPETQFIGNTISHDISLGTGITNSDTDGNSWLDNYVSIGNNGNVELSLRVIRDSDTRFSICTLPPHLRPANQVVTNTFIFSFNSIDKGTITVNTNGTVVISTGDALNEIAAKVRYSI